MKLNWNFLGDGGGGGVQNKKPSVGGIWIFSGTAHYINTHFSQTTKHLHWFVVTVPWTVHV